jgi:menaquinone-dependent protoporphyrinogen oxidase
VRRGETILDTPTRGKAIMTNRVLVTYATRGGSTAGVAEAIAQVLAEDGWSVERQPMDEVKDVATYDAVVAGSAIHGKQWLPEAMAFLEANQAALRRRPCAIFLVCMTLAMRDAEKHRPMVAEFHAPVRALVHPVSEAQFAGALDLSKISSFWARFGFRISVWTGVWKEGDHRDWDAIRAWAHSISPLLRRVATDA